MNNGVLEVIEETPVYNFLTLSIRPDRNDHMIGKGIALFVPVPNIKI
jgi:hypothetical protein